VRDIRSALGWRGLVQYLDLWDSLATLNSTVQMILISGNLKLQVHTPLDQLTGIPLLVLSPSNLGNNFGNLGHPANAKHFVVGN